MTLTRVAILFNRGTVRTQKADISEFTKQHIIDTTQYLKEIKKSIRYQLLRKSR